MESSSIENSVFWELSGGKGTLGKTMSTILSLPLCCSGGRNHRDRLLKTGSDGSQTPEQNKEINFIYKFHLAAVRFKIHFWFLQRFWTDRNLCSEDLRLLRWSCSLQSGLRMCCLTNSYVQTGKDRQVIRLTSLQTGLLFLKVLWSHDLQQGVEEGHVGQLTDQDQRLVERHKTRRHRIYIHTFLNSNMTSVSCKNLWLFCWTVWIAFGNRDVPNDQFPWRLNGKFNLRLVD